MKNNYTGVENSIYLCWREPHWAPRIAGYEQHQLFHCLIFPSLLTVGHQSNFTDLGGVWCPDFKKRLRGKYRVSESFLGKIQLQSSTGMAEWLWFLQPWLSWVGSALRFASSHKQHPKNSSVGGISLVCPAQGRGNIPAGWDCTGLCPVMFGRAFSMETGLFFIILLALKKIL